MPYKNLLFLLFCCLLSFIGTAQIYSDHFGTGNNIGVTITSSPDTDNTAAHSLSGTGYLVDTVGAYRFLAQAGFGGDSLQIDTLLQLGIENWLDWQMTMPYETFFDRYFAIHNDIVAGMYLTDSYLLNGNTPRDWNYTIYTPMVFYDKVLNDKDILRQKAAFALSQIFVIKLNASDIRKAKGPGYAKYYDILYEGAFGNFRDILKDVTLSVVMGDFLSYFQNRKADSESSIQPDENYARELMQLFTIGLHELNNDGTPKLDANCNTIPTYDLEDIKEMAQVFTGLYGAAIDSSQTTNYTFYKKVHLYDWDLPMVMDSSHHDTSTKILPNGDTILANQNGMLDIEMALDWLFKHDNVGPFIARRLIQQLVKSNPTPAYINRVATAFNNNGSEVRGDMGAVFRAILLDTEARDCQLINHPHAGKLLQPMERNINLFKAFGVHTPSGKFRFIDAPAGVYTQGEERYSRQAFLRAPSVFNFFSPFYAESEFVDTAGLVSPEFEILNSVTSIHYINRTRDVLERMGRWNRGITNPSIDFEYEMSPFVNFTAYQTNSNVINISRNDDDRPELDFRDEVCVCKDRGKEALLDHLDMVLCRGQLSPHTKELILENIETQMTDVDDYESAFEHYMINPPLLEYACIDEIEEFNCLRIVKEMVYFIMLSPDYIILK